MIFAHLSDPNPITGPAPPRCTRKASAILPHSTDARPIAVCRTRSGSRVYLCAGCLAALRAERFAASFGHDQAGEQQLGVLTAVYVAPAGYEPPRNGHRANQVWHAVKMWASLGLTRRVERRIGETFEILYVMRDACPDPQCLRRVGHSENCSLTYGDAFAERVVKHVR